VKSDGHEQTPRRNLLMPVGLHTAADPASRAFEDAEPVGVTACEICG
jgi:hypothetical protein